jgi:hypothetical protein
VQCLFSGIASPERAHCVARMLLSPESFTGWGVRMVACAPQSWSAASVFLLFQACLGLDINGPEAQVYFTRPHPPISLGELRIHHLEVAGATVDVLLVRHEQDVGVNVLRCNGDVYTGFQISVWQSRAASALPGSAWPSPRPLPEGEGE